MHAQNLQVWCKHRVMPRSSHLLPQCVSRTQWQARPQVESYHVAFPVDISVVDSSLVPKDARFYCLEIFSKPFCLKTSLMTWTRNDDIPKQLITFCPRWLAKGLRMNNEKGTKFPVGKWWITKFKMSSKEMGRFILYYKYKNDLFRDHHPLCVCVSLCLASGFSWHGVSRRGKDKMVKWPPSFCLQYNHGF